MAAPLQLVGAVRRSLVAALLLAGGCDPPLEVSTDLAHVEVSSLEMYIGSFTMWGDLQLVRDSDSPVEDPCEVLGTDFHAHVGKLELSSFPGGVEDVCHHVDFSSPCIEDAPRCAYPFVSLAWPPPMPTAELVIADRTRSITCELGDAFAARTMSRVPEGASWDVARGEPITVRVSPGSDVSRFVVDVYVIEPGRAPVITLPYTTSGDTLTFRVPSDLRSGAATLYVHLDGFETVACDVPARALHSYVIEQPIRVQ